jgi:hypothetical protein
VERFGLRAPVEAVRLTKENVREVSEWMVPEPDRGGYFQYGAAPARIRTLEGQIEVPLGHWVTRLGNAFFVVEPAEFERAFAAALPPT